jgi:hypothetical protein
MHVRKSQYFEQENLHTNQAKLTKFILVCHFFFN